MLKVFIVEDESVVREGLRDNIPWQQYGYRFVGEASDGEMALPMIRKLQPDVLITDIKMPFMDGLSLSHIVNQEFPDTKIIIISGYDDFEYARRAINEGVEQYLLKPITRSSLQKVLAEVKEKIEAIREQKSYIVKFQSDINEYKKFFLRNYFEKLFDGKLSVQEMYEEAQKNAIDVSASCYNLIFVSLQEQQERKKQESEVYYENTWEELMHYFLRFSEYVVFQWSMNTYGIMLKGETDSIAEQTNRCMDHIEQICSKNEAYLEWYAAAGIPVERFSMLSECYAKVNHIFSQRFFNPGIHILTANMLDNSENHPEEGALEKIDTEMVNPDIIRRFLINGQKNDIYEFVKNYMEGLSEAIRSKLFRDYLLLNVRFTTLAYVEELGCNREEFLKMIPNDKVQEMVVSLAHMQNYLISLLECAIGYRDDKNSNQGKKILKKALDYIDENYMKETLSLNKVSEIVEVSPSYFSTTFSQEMQMTFIEYVTEKRMKQAKKLLRESDMHSGEIAAKVGYKDPHYFSFVFKKTQGCTPREYHNKKVLEVKG